MFDEDPAQKQTVKRGKKKKLTEEQIQFISDLNENRHDITLPYT